MTVALPRSFRLVALDKVGSTNAEALRLAAGGAPSGTVVWAREQREGRGRRGRRWESPPGNLYCTVLLRPDVAPAASGQLSLVAAVALAEALAALAPGAAVHLKWPNDVLLRGSKIAGILIEAGEDGAVAVGTGVNVAGAPPGAAFLQEVAAGVTPESVLAAYAATLEEWLARWRADGFAPVRAAWIGRASGLGRPIEVRLAAETLHGTFAELDESGALVLAGAGGTRHISAGDVFLLSPAH